MKIKLGTSSFQVTTVEGTEVTQEVWEAVGGAVQQTIADAVLNALRGLPTIVVVADQLDVTFGVEKKVVEVISETYTAQ